MPKPRSLSLNSIQNPNMNTSAAKILAECAEQFGSLDRFDNADSARVFLQGRLNGARAHAYKHGSDGQLEAALEEAIATLKNVKPPPLYLHHITLVEGGNVVTHRLDTLDPQAVAACRALLPGGGQVPRLPAFRVEIHGPVFTIWRGREPLVTCGVGQGEDETWLSLWEMQAKFWPVDKMEPPGGTWLAVVVLPSFLMLAPQDQRWIADFERCLAAAMLLPEKR